MKKFLLLSYAVFLLLLSVFSYTFIDSNLVYLHNLYSGFSFTHRTMTAIFFTAFVVIFFLFYLLFLDFLLKDRLSTVDIKILIGISIGMLFFSYSGMLSYDIFNYIATAKVLYFYKENPYVVMPIDFANDPLLLFTRAANKISLYGPWWLLLSFFPYAASLGNFLVELFLFKLLNVFFYLGTVYGIWKLSQNKLSVYLFALNPLVLVETFIGSHNDIVMIFFALWSFYFLKQKKILFAIIVFFLSILIKYATIFLLPVFIYVFWLILQKRSISWEKVFFIAIFSMFVIFLLSAFREEIYPWYGLWFIGFACLIPKKKLSLNIALIFTFSLMLRYIPYMFSGTYAGYTPIIKTILAFSLPILFLGYYSFKLKKYV